MGDERIYEQAKAELPIESVQERKPPRPLTEEETLEIAETRRLVHILAPEIVRFISEVRNEGMIDGWRSVKITRLNDHDSISEPGTG